MAKLLFDKPLPLPMQYKAMTKTQRVRARTQYAEEQGGNCCHCHAPLSGDPARIVLQWSINPKLFPPGFLDHPLHLHHDHKTGLTIGVVHARCNAVLWQYHGE